MVLALGGYALLYGWQFGVGLVALIFVHECGHLVAARKVGLKVGAPVFIPFMGAIIALKEAPKNAWIEAQVAIGGPLLGSLGALICYGLFLATGNPLFKALTYTGFFLNLFNLAPIGFLDGGRVATALSPWLWVVGTVIMVAMIIASFNPLLCIILVLSIPRLISLFRKRTDEEKRYFEVTPAQRALMAFLYFGLAAALAAGMKFLHDSSSLR
jgi:Zn-dependent protease